MKKFVTHVIQRNAQ